MPEIEYRTIADVQLRADDGVPGFSGYASTWWSADSYHTAMAPKAFRKSISERGDRVPVLAQHDPTKPIGRHRSLKEDKTGLLVDVELVDDGADGTVTLKRLRGGVPLAMSFGFQTIKDRAAEDDDPLDLSQLPKGIKAGDIRVITEVKLWETSVVTFPANEAATITAVREQILTEHLSTLIESMRAGTLTDEQAAQIEALVTEWPQHRAGAGPAPTSLADERAKRDREIQIALTLASVRGYLTGD
jgi:HK97 family phage prohead protease